MSSHVILFNKRNNKKIFSPLDERIVFHNKKYYNLNLICKRLLENIKEICFSFYFVFLLSNYIYILQQSRYARAQLGIFGISICLHTIR